MLKIEIGNELPIINKIGGLIGFFGVLLFLISGLVLFVGGYLPFEMKLIYFMEVVHQNVYLTFILSIILMIEGFEIADLKKYIVTDLEISDDFISFYKGSEKVELPNKKIHKFIEKKPFSDSKKRIQIKTIGLKRYESKMDKSVFVKLTELYPEKMNLNKNIG